jgi:predicted nuclease of restriction endonuclease-like (RecB) superfamily
MGDCPSPSTRRDLGRWSSRELDKQINSMLYERTALPRKPEQLLGALPAGATSLASHADAFKDPYVLDFLGLEDTFSEKDLEAALVRNREKFLLELGTVFYMITTCS